MRYLAHLTNTDRSSDLNWRMGWPKEEVDMFEGVTAPPSVAQLTASAGAPRRWIEEAKLNEGINSMPTMQHGNPYESAFHRRRQDALLDALPQDEQMSSIDFLDLLNRRRGTSDIRGSVEASAQSAAAAEAMKQKFMEALLKSAAAGGAGAAGYGFGQLANEGIEGIPDLERPAGISLPDMDIQALLDGLPSESQALTNGLPADFPTDGPDEEAMLQELYSALTATPEEAIGPLSDGPDNPVVGGLESEEHPMWPMVRDLMKSGLSEQDAWSFVRPR
jgi:hypothetical protein